MAEVIQFPSTGFSTIRPAITDTCMRAELGVEATAAVVQEFQAFYEKHDRDLNLNLEEASDAPAALRAIAQYRDQVVSPMLLDVLMLIARIHASKAGKF